MLTHKKKYHKKSLSLCLKTLLGIGPLQSRFQWWLPLKGLISCLGLGLKVGHFPRSHAREDAERTRCSSRPRPTGVCGAAPLGGDGVVMQCWSHSEVGFLLKKNNLASEMAFPSLHYR